MRKIEVLTLEKPRITFKSVGAVVGLTLAIAGIFMMFTIILILPGIGAFLSGILLAYAFLPSAKTTCPACDLEIKAKLGVKNTKCEHCETTIPIKWKKPAA